MKYRTSIHGKTSVYPNSHFNLILEVDTVLENGLGDYYQNYHKWLILNGLFLFVLARNKDLVKRKRLTYHVANITVAETIYGFVIFCFFIVLLHRIEVTYETLLMFNVACYVGYFASRAAVLLMTNERSIVITKPLTWNDIVPRKRMLLFMLWSWIAVVTLTAVYHYLLWKIYSRNLELFYISSCISTPWWTCWQSAMFAAASALCHPGKVHIS